MAPSVTKNEGTQMSPKEVKKAARKAARKGAIANISDLIKAINLPENADKVAKLGIGDPKLYLHALSVIRPSLFERVVSTSYQKFVKAVATAKTISEEDIFKTFKMGRKECSVCIKKALKKSEPANRIWISFDAEKGVYSHIATGPTPPKGWTGYVPTDENTLLK